MKFDKIILPSFILLVLLLSLTAISASDLNSTDNISEDILKDTSSDIGSYNDFSNNMTDDSSFSLEKNYTYNDATDNDYSTGILIYKNNFVINGNNHAIDGNNRARAFNVTGKNVTINNLIIKNTVYESGSAICTISSLTLNNVTFINCTPCNNNQTYNCGAILSQGAILNINNCKFIDTYGNDGASLTSHYSLVNIVNSSFISSSSKIVKGHIYLYQSNMTVFNTTFSNTSSRYATAIFAEGSGNIIISKSRFKNLAANKTAGAIAVKTIKLLEISECEFDNVSSANNGGAIFVDCDNEGLATVTTLIDKTEFVNCSSDFGGALLQLEGSLSINNTNFSSNSAGYEGGAIYTSYVKLVISNSRFISNVACDSISYGGACYFDKSQATIEGCNFTDNTGVLVSTIFSYDTLLSLENNYFNNPSTVPSIYFVYEGLRKNESNNFNDDWMSLNNTDYSHNFEGSPNTFVWVNDTHVFDVNAPKFDLRDYGWVSPVKNQGFMGACWAFGTLAALESTLMRYANVTLSLSVNNVQNSMLRYSKYGDTFSYEGGFPFSAATYLIDWMGVFPDYYDSYDELGKISSLYITPDDIHIQNAVIIPKRKNSTDNYLIKNALINYGAVAVSHRADFDESLYFNKANSAQYYNSFLNSNHRVCIVGWDDTYSADNFVKRPDGDGAWIVKNSFGTDWGDGGYFYISYYDRSLATDRESVAFVINNDSYGRIYQHDVGGKYAVDAGASYYCNVFVAEEDELIAAVGTLFNKTGMDYEFTISINGSEVYSQSGVSKFGGYETIKLNKYIQIKKGDVFNVTFKNLIPVCYCLRIHTPEGQSFAREDGKEWEDLGKKGILAILKAYTIPDLHIDQNSKNYYYGDSFIVKVGAGEKVVFEINGSDITSVADKNGLAKLDLNYAPGAYAIRTTYHSTSIVSNIVISSSIVGQDTVRAYNSDYDYVLQLHDTKGTPLSNTSVKILINGVSKSFTSNDFGYVTVKFTNLKNSQTIDVTNPITGESRTVNIKVVSRFSDEADVVMYYFDGSQFKIKLLDDNGNAVGKNQIVTIKLNKKIYMVKTDAKGYAVLKIPKTVKPGKYQLTATFKGQTIRKTVKVMQNLNIKKYTVKKSAKKLVIKANLKNANNAVKNKKLTLKINGKKITSKTNKKGVAKFTIKKNILKKLKIGKKYTIKVCYLNNVVKSTLKVKR